MRLHVQAVQSAVQNAIKKAEKEGKNLFEILLKTLDVNNIDVKKIKFTKDCIWFIFVDDTDFQINYKLIEFDKRQEVRELFIKLTQIIQFSLSCENNFEILNDFSLGDLEEILKITNQIVKIYE